MDTTTAIQRNNSHTKKFISLICLRPPYLQVCLPLRLHLLACVTSCLSHYLPVYISVCPPASAPPLFLKETLLPFEGWKLRKQWSFFSHSFPAFLLGFYYGTIQYNTIYYPRRMFYITSLFNSHAFLLHSVLSPSPQLCSQFTGGQEGWLRAAVPLPKPTASQDERPPLIALPGLLLSKQSTSHPLRKCVQFTLQPCQLYSHTPWQWWNYFGVCSKYNLARY